MKKSELFYFVFFFTYSHIRIYQFIVVTVYNNLLSSLYSVSCLPVQKCWNLNFIKYLDVYLYIHSHQGIRKILHLFGVFNFVGDDLQNVIWNENCFTTTTTCPDWTVRTNVPWGWTQGGSDMNSLSSLEMWWHESIVIVLMINKSWLDWPQF